MGNNKHESRYTGSVQGHLQKVQTLLGGHALAESLAERQERYRGERREPADSLPHQQRLNELRETLDRLHSADIAYILEALPLEQRLLLWALVQSGRGGEILIEASVAVRKSLIAVMSRDELREAAEQLDTDAIADLAPHLPQPVMHDVFKSLPIEKREQLREAMSYPEDAVGALMDFDRVTIRDDVTLKVVLRYLRRFAQLPDQTDQLFVIDRDEKFLGVLPMHTLLTSDPEMEVAALMLHETVILHADDKAQQAAQAFERYDLVSAPVVDEDGRLLGRVTVHAVMDFIRAAAEGEMRNLAGLREEEDPSAPPWKSAQNRWMWLALNLCAAFFASRVIGVFESTIAKYVALATLMPIVAGIAGYSGNQTAIIAIRALAQGQIGPANARRVLAKELAISGLNGLIWGGVAGLFAYLLYRDVSLGVVLLGAILLNLLLGAAAGMLLPLALQRMGRDPATGSSVMLAAITGSGGYFLFLGLAALFLVH